MKGLRIVGTDGVAPGGAQTTLQIGEKPIRPEMQGPAESALIAAACDLFHKLPEYHQRAGAFRVAVEFMSIDALTGLVEVMRERVGEADGSSLGLRVTGQFAPDDGERGRSA